MPFRKLIKEKKRVLKPNWTVYLQNNNNKTPQSKKTSRDISVRADIKKNN